MLMKTIITAITITILPVMLFAQTVKVVDSLTSEPIEGVFVYGKAHLVKTGSTGEADISSFGRDEILTFQHPNYRTFKASFQELESSSFIVKLRENIFSYKITVTAAHRFEQNKKEIPSKISSITNNEVEFQNPQTAADLLGVTNEVFVQKSQLGGGSPMIRGFSANRVLLVVDGVRMNNAIFRSGNVQNVISLDADSVESSEVIFGPGSAIYGSDAIGGVMDFHTAKPALSANDSPYLSSDVLARFSSSNREKTGHYDFNFGTRKLGFLSRVKYSDFGDLRMGGSGNDEYRRLQNVERIDGEDIVVTNENPNHQKPTGYSQINLMQKIRYRPDDNWDVNYGFHYSETSNVPRYDRLIETRGGKPRSAEWFYGPQKWMLNILNIQYAGSTSLFNEAKITAAFQRFEESRNDRKFGDPQLRKRVENVDAYSLNLNFFKKLSEENSLFYGGEVILSTVGSTGQSVNIETGAVRQAASRNPDGSDWSSYAAYLNYKSNFHEKFTFVTGARYNQVSLSADFDKTFYPFPFDKISFNTGALNGSVGLVYRPDDSWQINMNASTGFRAPNIDDVGKVFDSEPGSVVVPNEDLGPEYAWNFDLGIIKTINNRIQIDASAFYTILRDAMVRRDFQFNGQDYILYDGEPSRVQALQNADEATVYGFHLAFYADLTDNLSLRSNLNHTHGETKEGEPLRHAAPLFGSTHLIFRSEKFRADLYADYNGEIAYENLAPTERSKPHIYATDPNGNPYSPAWWTINFKASRRLSKRLLLSFGIENILDARYRPYSSGVAAPGRNVVAALRINF